MYGNFGAKGPICSARQSKVSAQTWQKSDERMHKAKVFLQLPGI